MKLETVVMVENCMMWACITALAITFEKWWIVFLAALFHLYAPQGPKE